MKHLYLDIWITLLNYPLSIIPANDVDLLHRACSVITRKNSQYTRYQISIFNIWYDTGSDAR